jgi:hypothetical protein
MELLILLGAISAVASLAVFIIRMHKKQQAELAAALTQAGYQAIPQLDPELERDLEGLSVRSRKAAEKVKNIYRHSGLNYDLYRYDVPGSESDQTCFAMDFRREIFPRFALFPNFKLPGFLSGLVSGLMKLAVAGQSLQEVEVPGKPRFRERFRLYSDDAHALLSAVPAHVWDRLSDLPGYLCLQGRGRTLLLYAMVQPKQRSANSPALEVRKMIETADALWHAFSEVRPQHEKVR